MPFSSRLGFVSDSPWFREGLCFECTQCGNCCTGSSGAVWVEDADIRRIADYLARGEAEIRVMHARPVSGRTSLVEFVNGDCTFFDSETRRCRVYPVRPVQCRTWPFWKPNLESPEAWESTQRECPGAGKGRRVPLDELMAMLGEVEV